AALTAASRNNNTYNPRVKDYDMPLAVKVAMRSLDSETTAASKQTDDDNNNYNVQPKHVSISTTSVRDKDQPLTVKWAASLPNQKQLKQQKQNGPNSSLSQGFTSNPADSPES